MSDIVAAVIYHMTTNGVIKSGRKRRVIMSDMVAAVIYHMTNNVIKSGRKRRGFKEESYHE